MAKKKQRRNESGRQAFPLARLTKIIRDEIALLPDWDDEDDQAALVMLAPLSIGTRDPDAVSRFTGLSVSLIRKFYERIDESAVLRPGEMAAAAWADPINGKYQFNLDVWVATGKLKRAKQRVFLTPSSHPTQ